jgi:phosphoribosylglycinamide formyltransferase-1
VHLSSRTHPDPAALDRVLRDTLVAESVDLVLLAGYMKRLGPLVLGTFAGRILNTLPALLPRFEGPGMHGDHVHEAVLNAGERETGASVHIVEAAYDSGPVISQRFVLVLPADSVDTLRDRVQEQERELIVQTLAAVAQGRIALPVPLRPE